jgi:hyperosmotically inducible protein
MKMRFLGRFLMSAALLAGGAFASTKNNANLPRTDQQIAEAVRHEIAMYPYYGIFDDVGFRVVNGQVKLSGDVTQPVKKSDIGRIVQQVPGVTSVANDLRVLPLSDFDNRLRIQVARAVFRSPVLSRYAMEPVPSIHIIVDNGHVTLTGVVATDMEKQVAGMQANGAGLGFGQVTNKLVVENPAKKS